MRRACLCVFGISCVGRHSYPRATRAPVHEVTVKQTLGVYLGLDNKLDQIICRLFCSVLLDTYECIGVNDIPPERNKLVVYHPPPVLGIDDRQWDNASGICMNSLGSVYVTEGILYLEVYMTRQEEQSNTRLLSWRHPKAQTRSPNENNSDYEKTTWKQNERTKRGGAGLSEGVVEVVVEVLMAVHPLCNINYLESTP